MEDTTAPSVNYGLALGNCNSFNHYGGGGSYGTEKRLSKVLLREICSFYLYTINFGKIILRIEFYKLIFLNYLLKYHFCTSKWELKKANYFS